MPLMKDPGHAELIKSMTTKVPQVLGLGTSSAPRAILLVTAHWSQRRPTISNAKKHNLYYDYYGFPSEAYNLKYEAPGSPEVAGEVYEVLEKAGLNPEMDSERGAYIMSLPALLMVMVYMGACSGSDDGEQQDGITASSFPCSSSTPKPTSPSSNSPCSPPTPQPNTTPWAAP